MKNLLSDYLTKYNAIAKTDGAEIKVAVLRSVSCELLEKALTVDLVEMMSLRPTFWFGGFNQYAQEILSADSELYKFAPNYTIVLVHIENLCPEVFDNYYETDDHESQINNAVDNFVALIETYQKQSHGETLVCNFAPPYFANITASHSQSPHGIPNLIALANIRLAELLKKNGARVVDLHDVIYQIGASNAYDAKMFFAAKNPYAFETYAELSKRLTNLLYCINGKRKKCVVLDLDNTIWRGVVGEDRPEITEAFRFMQAQLLSWNKTGVLLAVCSKNNYEDAIEIIRRHPEMLLRETHFAALRINWDTKPDNITSIAKELNIGLDSMIFVDDSEFECGFVRETLPQVQVIHLNGNSSDYPGIVSNIRTLDFLALTDEDKRRAVGYASQRERAEFREQSADLEAYLRGLQIEITVSPVNTYTIARAAQLTQKTNQFNLTTRRYTEQQLSQMLKDGSIILTLDTRDRFGDSGITGLTILRPEVNTYFIDTFLLSCRVMNRGIERALMAHIVKTAAQSGAATLRGEYIPTPKNAPVKDFYAGFGFTPIGSFWELATTEELLSPEWVQLRKR
jgi:FkbH-like protein